MKRSGWWLSLLVLMFLGLSWVTSQAEPKAGVRKFMRPKLDHAQKVLEGLTLEDYQLISQSAKSLLQLSEAADWQVLPSPEYVRQSAEFQRVANELIRAGDQKNLDSATLAYVQLTMTCVNCHKHVRESGRVAFPGPLIVIRNMIFTEETDADRSLRMLRMMGRTNAAVVYDLAVARSSPRPC